MLKLQVKVILVCIMVLLYMKTFFVVTKAAGKTNFKFSSPVILIKFSLFPLK